MDKNFSTAQTHVPDSLMTYCHQLAAVHHSRNLGEMYIKILQAFLAHKPWEANPPLPWQMAKIGTSQSNNVPLNVDRSWVPMNMKLPTKLFTEIKRYIEKINGDETYSLGRKLSIRTFLYTAICWWCDHVWPRNGPKLLGN